MIAAGPVRFVGVDFSGARRAGRNIWLTEGCVTRSVSGDRVLIVGGCSPATALPGGGDLRDRALHALRAHVIEARHRAPSAYGMDFPFTLPTFLLGDQTWKQFILSFGDRFSDPEQFRAWCRQLTGGRERKRRTEERARVPFAAYNLRLYRQTFYGIRDVLAPLVREKKAWVLPIQFPDLNRPWLMETCPASALKRLDLYGGYKGKEAGHRRHRERILSKLLSRKDVDLADPSLQRVVLENTGGDALDSLIAAIIAFWNASDPVPQSVDDPREGYVYR